MPVQYEWNISLELKDIIQAASFARILSKPAMVKECEEALAETLRLIRPAAIWEAIPIREFRHDQIILENGSKLAGGPVANVLAGATLLYVGVCTVGTEVCAAAMDARKNDLKIRAMFMDNFSGAAVGLIRQQLTEKLETEAKAKGLHVSTMLSPGESEWPITQQEILFNLVDAAKIGVTLTETMMMSPVKSLSMILGTSPNPLGSEGGTNCDYCTMRDTCEHSQARSKPVVTG